MSEEVFVTAKTRSGEVMTLTYGQWAIRNSCKKLSVQKRMSVRRKQLEEGKTPYTLERVVGTEVTGKKTFKRTKKETRPDLLGEFLKTRLV